MAARVVAEGVLKPPELPVVRVAVDRATDLYHEVVTLAAVQLIANWQAGALGAHAQLVAEAVARQEVEGWLYNKAVGEAVVLDQCMKRDLVTASAVLLTANTKTGWPGAYAQLVAEEVLRRDKEAYGSRKVVKEPVLNQHPRLKLVALNVVLSTVNLPAGVPGVRVQLVAEAEVSPEVERYLFHTAVEEVDVQDQCRKHNHVTLTAAQVRKPVHLNG